MSFSKQNQDSIENAVEELRGKVTSLDRITRKQLDLIDLIREQLADCQDNIFDIGKRLNLLEEYEQDA